MLERYYGKEAFIEDAAEHLLPEVYDRAIDENEVDAIARPEIDIIQINPLSFKATVPVRPTVELADYHEVQLVQETVELTDEEVSDVLEKVRDMQAPWVPVERPAVFGDLLTIDVEGTVDENVVINEKEGMYQLAPDPPNAVPGFAEKLEGATKGEERVFTLTLPENRGEFSGKECNFKVLINEIKEKNLPELDDEFAKSLGQGLETLEALKERISSDLKARKEMEAREKLEDQAIEALVAIARVEFPDVMVQRETDRLMDERERYFGDREKLQAYLESIKKTQDELREELRPMAENIVRRSAVLQKFAELEGIEVNAEEINSEVERITQQTSDERVRQMFDSQSTRETIGRNIFVRKALDRLIEMATGGEASATSGEEPVPQPSKEEEDDNGDATQ
jgi:trigger factor